MSLKLPLAIAAGAVWLYRRGTACQRRLLERQHQEDELDDALDDSFLASDPPSMTTPSVGPGTRNRH